MLTTIILLFCAVTLVVLAAAVIYSNYRAAANRWLGLFILSGLLWLLANLGANLATDNSGYYLGFSRVALIGSSLIPWTFLMFCLRFTGRKPSTLQTITLALPIVALLATTPTSLNVRSVSSVTGDVEPGIAYAVLLVIIVLYFTAGTRALLTSYHRASPIHRQQLYYILFGTSLTIIPALVLNGLLPLLGYSEAVSFGPVVVLCFATLTTIAIIRHRLFDIRLVIARAMAYATSLSVLALLYGVVVFGIAGYVFNLHISFTLQVFLSVATGFAAISFQYVRKRFDYFTNRLFFQDAYDPQELFDQLNKVLVSSLDINYLMKQSSGILHAQLRSEFCVIGIQDGEHVYRLFGDTTREFSDADIAKVRAITPHIHHNVIATDYLDDRHKDLQDILQTNGIAVLVRLVQNVRKTEEGIGYIALGVKKSGTPYGQRDIRVLESVANELIIAIQNALHYEEIQRFNEALQGRVDEATRKLRRSNEKLKALDETKDDFISMASHQLRTPLTSVKGYLSMVLEGDAGKLNATQHKMLQQAFTSSQRMVYLIADLLNVSRLRTGKFIIEPSPTNLAVMIEEELAQLVEAAKVKDIELAYNKPKEFPDLMLDETKTRQVIMNLIDNAIYYTPAGGHISVELNGNDRDVELRVVDDGIGVPKSEQHHLFTKFYRAGNARKARPDGTGLGLFMAKKVVVAQGGSIIFESKENVGSTFGFRFSRTKLAVAAPNPKT